MLTIDAIEKNLGNLKFGEPHIFKYILSNSGTTTIHITKILLGCKSCTTISFKKNIIGVNEKLDLGATFTPGATGINNKQIYIFYNDGSGEKQMTLTFKAIVTQ